MSRLNVPVTPSDHTLGPAPAPLTLVEYGDYQCPFCAAAHREIKLLLHSMPEDLRFVFRNFPLSQAHPYAFLGAAAAEAAHLQGRFWAMHDLILENQDLLNHEGIFVLAERLGLDLELFQSAMNSEDIRILIQEDYLGGVRSGVNGTPFVFANDAPYHGPLDAAVFKAAARPEAAENPDLF